MLDIKTYEDSRILASNMYAEVILDEEDDRYPFPRAVEKEEIIQLRYVVHRQSVGFFTPVVFDLKLKWIEVDGATDVRTQVAINYVLEPFIEGALFMNHTSQFILPMMKGMEAGYDRKHELEKIVDSIEKRKIMWYSDWFTPPITIQSQRIVVYDMDVTGSMLDPINVVKNALEWITDKRGMKLVYYASITAGYTQKTK